MSDYELNSVDVFSACLWFLMREKYRHLEDIERINQDISALERLGARLPAHPLLETRFKVPGGT